MATLKTLKETIKVLVEINQEVLNNGNDFESSYLTTQNETYNRVINIINKWEADKNARTDKTNRN
jgi:hypothetical protein